MWFTPSEIASRPWLSHSQLGSRDLCNLPLPLSALRGRIYIAVIVLLISCLLIICDYSAFLFSKHLLLLIFFLFHFIKAPIEIWIHEGKNINKPTFSSHINPVWGISFGQIQDLFFYSSLYFVFILILIWGFHNNNNLLYRSS